MMARSTPSTMRVLALCMLFASCTAATPAPPTAPPKTATPTTNKAAPADKPLLGGDCAVVAPASRMQCVFTTLMQWQAKEAAANGAASRPGGTCASVAPGPSREQCLSAWFMQRQLKQAPGMVGGCGGVAPQYKNSCIADSVIAMQKAQRTAGMAADQGMSSGHMMHNMGGMSMGASTPAAPGAKSLATTPPAARPTAAAGK